MFENLPTEVVILIADFCDVPSCSALSRTNRRYHEALHKALLRRGQRLRNPSVLGWFALKGKPMGDIQTFINDIAFHGLDVSHLEDKSLEPADPGEKESRDSVSGQERPVIDTRPICALSRLTENPSVFGVVIRYFEHERDILDFLAVHQHCKLDLSQSEWDEIGVRSPLVVAVSREFETVTSLLPMPPQNTGPLSWDISVHRLVQDVIEHGRRNILEILIDRGASLEFPDRETHALHHAAVYGQKDIVKFLIDRGFNVNLLDRKGHTPLSKLLKSTTCCPMRRDCMALYLLERGADTHIGGLSGEGQSLHAAVAGGLHLTAVNLLEHGAIIPEALKMSVAKSLVRNDGRFLTPRGRGYTKSSHGREFLNALAHRGYFVEEIAMYLLDSEKN